METQQMSQQMAALMMQLMQKREKINAIKAALNELTKVEDFGTMQVEVRRLVRKIKFEENIDEEWKRVSVFYDKAQQDFLLRLKKRFPELTHRDHKLCVYLRMNLTTKEIAPMMSISVRGVEISRYRLRKKLDLDKNENLARFLSNI